MKYRHFGYITTSNMNVADERKMVTIKRHIMPLLQVLTLVLLLWITVQPVEVRWADADGILCYVLPIIGVIGGLCILFTKDDGKLTIVDVFVTVWVSYYIGRVWIGSEYPCATEWLQTMETVVLYVFLRFAFHDTKIPAWTLCVGLVLFGCYEALVGTWQLIAGCGRHRIFALTGTFLNPGPYSAYLMVAATIGICHLPFAKHILSSCINRLSTSATYQYLNKKCRLQKLVRGERTKEVAKEIANYLILTVLCLPLLILPATWSRAAFVGLGVCALWMSRKSYWQYRWYVFGTLAVMAVGLYFVKRGSADGRSLIWMASLTSWCHDLWLGVGVGGFRHACAEGIAEMWYANPDSELFASAGVADYAYNALVKVLVEQGLVGALLWIAITVLAMRRLCQRSVSLFMAMVSLIVFSMFSYPFELLPYRVVAVMVFAWSESGEKSGLCLRINKISCTFLCLMAIAFSLFLNVEITERITRDKEASLFTEMRNSAFLPDYYELLPCEIDNSQYLFDFAKTLRDEKRYEDSNAILRQGTRVSADPMFYIIMGNNYCDEQLYDLAKGAYEKAHSIMPNRLYPMYQLMMMYAEKGDKALANDMAERIRRSYVKIESEATKQMQEKADSILGRQ